MSFSLSTNVHPLDSNLHLIERFSIFDLMNLLAGKYIFPHLQTSKVSSGRQLPHTYL